MAPSAVRILAASYGIFMSAAPFCLLLTGLGVVGFGFFLELIVNEPEWQTRQQLAGEKEKAKKKSRTQTPSAATDARVAPGMENGHKGFAVEVFSVAVFIVLISLCPLFLKTPRCRPRLGTERCHGGDDGLCLAGCESIRCAGSTAAE